MRLVSIVLITTILVISAGCAGRQTAEVAPVANPVTDECLRLATSGSGKVPGWKLVSPVGTYDKQTIFEYINGAAELYFAYDFRSVAAAEYQNGKTSIMIDVYDMTTPDSAFGIYSLNRYPEASYVDIGNEGIMSGPALDFWKGRYFCKVYSFDMSGKYQDDVVNFGRKLSSEIQEAGKEPFVVGNLPQNGLIPRSAKFFSRKLGLDNIHYVSEENVLNLGPETQGVVAEYQIDNIPFQLFTIEYPSKEEANSAFEAYINYLEDKTVSIREKNERRYKLIKRDDKFTILEARDRFLSGVWDIEVKEAAESVLQIMR